MQQNLPYQGFEWMNESEMKNLENDPREFLKEANLESTTGSFIECDLKVPEDLHSIYDELPLGPEKRKVDYAMLSPYQKKIAEKNKLNLNVTLNSERLILTLEDKKNYIVHSTVLKYYLDHGLILKKVHRALKFDQAPFLRAFVDSHLQKRKMASTKFLKFYYKLIVNSVYG
jgi:hypothetical protein